MRISWFRPAALLLAALLAAAGPAFAQAFKVETVLRGLEHPWSLNVAPDGALFITERPGRLLRLDPAAGKVEAIGGVPRPRVQGEAGLLGMALDPGFAGNGLVYLCYSTRDDAGRSTNRLARFRLAGGALAGEAVLFDGMPGNTYHNGCRVIMAPDDAHLFFSMGDAGKAMQAQSPAYRGGKIFRLALDGSVPADNPIPGSAVWSLGHRNPQGLRFRPGGDELWSTEHGPDTQDELNLIVKGGNYGWPQCRGTDSCPGLANYHPAIAEFEHDRTVATSDLIFYSGKAFPAWKGNILFVTLKTGRLYRIVLDGDRVAQQQILIDGDYGRLRDLAEAPDGSLYIATGNGDDVILRLAPK